MAMEEKRAVVSGVKVKAEVEEIEEEVEEEEVEEEEEEEEIEEEEEEYEAGGEGAGEGEKPPGKAIDVIDSAREEIQQPISSSSSPGWSGVHSVPIFIAVERRGSEDNCISFLFGRKIFVGGITWDTTEETFTNHFAKYGKITDSVIMKDKHTQMPRGFGFVTFADPSVIDKVLKDEHVIDGRVVEVKRTVPREDMQSKGSPKSKKIFVGGIPPSLTEDEFKEHFSSYGLVVEHQIMLDHQTGRSRGFGFITFESEEAVEKIVSKGRMHDLAGKQVEIKKAEPKKAGSDVGFNVKAGYRGVDNLYGYGGGPHGYVGGYRSMDGYYGGRGGPYGYVGDYRSMDGYYGGRGGFYGRGGYGYSGAAGYGGGGFGSGYGAPVYGSAGFYDAVGGYGAGYSGYGGGRGGYGRRYHPYGR